MTAQYAVVQQVTEPIETEPLTSLRITVRLWRVMSISRTERFDRTLRLIGDSAMERLHNARVTVAGLGAVGSYAVEGLARAGVGNLCVIDFDHVEPSNINRQLYALESTLGQAKTDLCVKRIHDINPDCNVTPMNLFITQESVSEVIDPAPDILIDAIDSLNAKVTLIVSAIEAGIVVCSSMGAARRMDTTKIRIADISKTRHCPLARFGRNKLTIIRQNKPVCRTLLQRAKTRISFSIFRYIIFLFWGVNCVP